jgi:integrase
MAVKERPFKGSGHWHFDFRVSGARYRGTIPEARTKPQAKQAEAKLRTLIFEGKYEKAAKPMTFSEFLEGHYKDYCKTHVKAWRQMFNCAALACDFFAGKHLSEISAFHVEKYKVERIRTPTIKGTTRKANTLNHELMALSHALNLAVRLGFLKANPASRVRRPKWERRERYLTAEEESRLREVINAGRDPWIGDLTLFALNTGMRQSEILQLEWSRVDFSRGVVKVTQTKTCTAREVPLNAEARSVLEAREGGIRFVFAECGMLLHRATLSRRFKALKKEAEIEDFHFHDLRHTTATKMLDAGIRESVIARVLGHSSTAMTAIYAHVKDEQTKAAVESLGHVPVTAERKTA